jgi:hypothetical protein
MVTPKVGAKHELLLNKPAPAVNGILISTYFENGHHLLLGTSYPRGNEIIKIS